MSVRSLLRRGGCFPVFLSVFQIRKQKLVVSEFDDRGCGNRKQDTEHAEELAEDDDGNQDHQT